MFLLTHLTSPKLWATLSFSFFTVNIAATMFAIYLEDGTALSAGIIFFVAVLVSAILHYLVYRSIRNRGEALPLFAIIFSVLSVFFWLGQLAWYSLLGVACGVMLIVAINGTPAKADSADPVSD